MALLLFVIGSLAVGLVLGGHETGTRNVLGLGTAQRNVSAAIVVSAQNFSGTNTLTFVMVAAVVLLVILMATARQLDARVHAPAASAAQSES